MRKNNLVIKGGWILGVIILSACSSGRTLPGVNTGIPTLPVIADDDIQEIMGSTGVAQTALSGLASPAATKLGGAMINKRGSVHAVIFPVSYGLRRPAWKEQQIAYQMFGVAADSLERADGVAARLADASAGALRLNAAMVMPVLVNTAGSEGQVVQSFQSGVALQRMAMQLITPWLNKVNLASYDNDGPDGLPSSGDDDGSVDLPIVLLETDTYSASTVVPVNQIVQTGPAGRFKIRIAAVLVVAVPRNAGLDPDNLGPMAAVVKALGVRSEPMFTLGHPAGEMSIESRLQLGWAHAVVLGRSGNYNLTESQVYVVPVLDVPGGGAKWLVEGSGDRVYATRVARRGDGGWVRTNHKELASGQDYRLPLTSLGEAGSMAQVVWRGQNALLNVSLSGR